MGEKRKAMVRKYEYDVKNAAHLIRLLRMGKEFLETGALNVFRTHDAQELIDIKQGKWTLSQVRAEAEKLFAEVRAAEANSNLPKRPDTVRANRILMEIHTAMLGLNVQRGL
jgi:1,4-alpha-glucan branching enzyme